MIAKPRKGGERMHDIWNPWHGCVKKSEGCAHCYMYYLDRVRSQGDGSQIYRTAAMRYPLARDRAGNYKIRPGEMLRVCMTSDFFLAEADEWREEAWSVMRARPDVMFFLLTKRPERVAGCLPKDWDEGWENVFFNVSCENQRRADERLPYLLSLPFKHKGVMCAPFIGAVSMQEARQIEQVLCGGENYDGARPCHFEWVQALHDECAQANVTFNFIETGTVFVKDGKRYQLSSKRLQSRMAYKSGMNFQGKVPVFDLRDPLGWPIPESERYTPRYGETCDECASRLTCNGCADCGRCERHQ